MSAWQATGVLFGVFPLVVAALENHQKLATRLKLFAKTKTEYMKCRNELTLQQLTFTRHLKRLLLPLVDSEKVQELIDRPTGEAWRDASMVELLEKRLGDSFQLYQEYIEGMNHVMDELYHELALNDESVQSKLLDASQKRPATVSRIRSAFGKDDLSFQLFRLHFSNGESVRCKLFAELQAYNDKLDKLLDSSDKLSALEQRKFSREQETAIDKHSSQHGTVIA
ncbi:uncharacterized protein Triagg1_491 [Trichoderma aggressivum f. europaeum]|uniref:Uncharacterized protein n=1 Tax=Trichoderma aggressivum f. europaeum TaxID=173218 RepID=A0AAE1ILG1_9HYPO|nr:hypothetical protein Triagg1_491 [Trichoderma aggressivum f. europaeum]